MPKELHPVYKQSYHLWSDKSALAGNSKLVGSELVLPFQSQNPLSDGAFKLNKMSLRKYEQISHVITPNSARLLAVHIYRIHPTRLHRDRDLAGWRAWCRTSSWSWPIYWNMPPNGMQNEKSALLSLVQLSHPLSNWWPHLSTCFWFPSAAKQRDLVDDLLHCGLNMFWPGTKCVLLQLDWTEVRLLQCVSFKAAPLCLLDRAVSPVPMLWQLVYVSLFWIFEFTVVTGETVNDHIIESSSLFYAYIQIIMIRLGQTVLLSKGEFCGRKVLFFWVVVWIIVSRWKQRSQSWKNYNCVCPSLWLCTHSLLASVILHIVPSFNSANFLGQMRRQQFLFTSNYVHSFFGTRHEGLLICHICFWYVYWPFEPCTL